MTKNQMPNGKEKPKTNDRKGDVMGRIGRMRRMKELNFGSKGRVLRLGEPKAAVVHPVSDWE